MTDTVLQLNVDPVLLEIHMFFKQFPAVHWQNAHNDAPFRTVKTIVYNLVKMFRGSVRNTYWYILFCALIVRLAADS